MTELDGFITRLKNRGPPGNKRIQGWRKNPEPYHLKMNINKSDDNILDLQCEWFGRKGRDQLGDTYVEPTLETLRKFGTYYTFGQNNDENKILSGATQIDIIKGVTGEDIDLQKLARERRQARWKDYFMDVVAGDDDYERIDMPRIVLAYGDVLGFTMDNIDCDDIPSELIDKVKSEIVSILCCSYVSWQEIN